MKADWTHRFWSKIQQSSGCWNWVAYKCKKGYGNFRLNGKIRKAHRVSYELLKGIIPENLQIDHLCKNKACVNPDHLEPVTCIENLNREENNLSSVNRRKTRCPKGHEYMGYNLIKRKVDGGRDCRMCNNERNRRSYHNVRKMQTA